MSDAYEPTTYALKLRIVNLEEKVDMMYKVLNAMLEKRKGENIDRDSN